tara:strand:- start:109 stop:663 length:555 start_codon:yes stop_codon:yes gene_type:complete
MLKINIVKSDEKKVFKTVAFEARRSVSGDLMIYDHDLIDIVVSKDGLKVTTFPKTDNKEESYLVQESLLYHLSKNGILRRSSIRSGSFYSSLEGDILESAIEGVSSYQSALLEIYNFLQEEKPNIDARKLYTKDLQQYFLDPSEQDTTELGEVPHKEKKGSLDHQVRPYGYQYMYSLLREMLER